MKLFEGLFLYQIILLILGVLFFLTLLILFVIFVINKRQVKNLIYFFVVAIIMIAWPSIKKIQIGIISAETNSLTQELKQDPTNLTARTKLIETVSKIERQPNLSPTTLLKVADAYAALEDTLQALKYIDRTLKSNPELISAIDRKKTLTTPRIRVESEIVKLSQNPTDSSARKELETNLSEIEKSPITNPRTFITIAKAKAALGDSVKAKQYLDSALIYEPNSKEAIEVGRRLRIFPR